MHVLVATDGSLEPKSTATFATALAGPNGRATVLTVIAIPHKLLSDLRGVYGERAPANVDGDAEYIGMSRDPGTAPPGWPGDQKMIDQYLIEKRDERCEPITSALLSAGIPAESRVVEGEQIARAIISEITASDADVLVLGSHGEGRFEGLLGGTGTKLARHAPCPVLVLR